MQVSKLQSWRQSCSIISWSICNRSLKSSAPAGSLQDLTHCLNQRGRWRKAVIERVMYPTGEQIHNECLQYFISAEQLQLPAAQELPCVLRGVPKVWDFLTSETRLSQICLFDEDFLPEKRKILSYRLFQAAKQNSSCGMLMYLSSDDAGLIGGTSEVLNWCWQPLQDVLGDIHCLGKTPHLNCCFSLMVCFTVFLCCSGVLLIYMNNLD